LRTKVTEFREETPSLRSVDTTELAVLIKEKSAEGKKYTEEIIFFSKNPTPIFKMFSDVKGWKKDCLCENLKSYTEFLGVISSPYWICCNVMFCYENEHKASDLDGSSG
jgi:hypothetical protein